MLFFFLDDGTIKVWSNIVQTGAQPKVVASWVAITESLDSRSGERGGFDVYTDWLDETKLVSIHILLLFIIITHTHTHTLPRIVPLFTTLTSYVCFIS